ncbi:germination protein YpeB [Paenibacillus sp.]|jgi:spore germination protein|uniref:germination protein YpeB n=1 Tax=Paenibacillus sp. TaxID=58172 RepID=UPI002835A15D|nr:germination protein YpeB [Paenibacillus sp.]MDR0269087.1 germination protein YpeB [Paenibacillus sp.]
MYKRLSAVLFPIVTLFMIGAFVWGYQENQEKNAVLIKAENQYQRAFHDLSYHMDRLHSELGNTLAVSSSSNSMHRKGLINVWRLTSEAQNEINQLPLTMLPFNKTEELLSRISNFSYQTSMRNLDKEPLSKDELKNLKTLYKNSADITKDLQDVQSKVISNRLRWMDVESAMVSAEKAMDNTIIDGFKTVDKRVGEYPELNWGPAVSSMYEKRSVKMLSGIPVSKEDIKRKAAKFANAGSNASIQVTENGKGTDWESYTATVKSHHLPAVISMDFTKKGGLLIGYHDNRNIGKKSVTIQQAKLKADRFLKNKGYKDMTAVTADQYGNMGNLTYVYNQEGVLVYPEKITVRVGLDNGEVTGFQASDYVYVHKEGKRQIPKPKMTMDEVRKKLNPEFKETYSRTALIKDDQSKEVLCYEFGGNINGTRYRLYMDTSDGSEKIVEELKSSDLQAAVK